MPMSAFLQVFFLSLVYKSYCEFLCSACTPVLENLSRRKRDCMGCAYRLTILTRELVMCCYFLCDH